MNERYFSQCGDTDQCEILLRVGTKNREKGLVKADQMINDLISAISFTLRAYEKAPNFKKSLKSIEKTLWKCLRT